MRNGVALVAVTLSKPTHLNLAAKKPSMPKKPKPDDPAQSKRFIEAAREAEADETERGADKAFKKIASNKVRHGRTDS